MQLSPITTTNEKSNLTFCAVNKMYFSKIQQRYHLDRNFGNELDKLSQDVFSKKISAQDGVDTLIALRPMVNAVETKNWIEKMEAFNKLLNI